MHTFSFFNFRIYCLLRFCIQVYRFNYCHEPGYCKLEWFTFCKCKTYVFHVFCIMCNTMGCAFPKHLVSAEVMVFCFCYISIGIIYFLSVFKISSKNNYNSDHNHQFVFGYFNVLYSDLCTKSAKYILRVK